VSGLAVLLKKKADGSAALSCRRADGSVTWQRQEGAQGRFFPLHDLTHLAVETELEYAQGFFGLVAAGWDITDFGRPWPRGELPAQALLAELIVGFLDGERAAGTRWSLDELRASTASYAAQSGRPVDLALRETDLDRIRERRGQLFAQWAALGAGETLELTFQVPSRDAAPFP
jgi:hypothetical protein